MIAGVQISLYHLYKKCGILDSKESTNYGQSKTQCSKKPIETY